MENSIISKINESIVVTESIKELASKITLNTETDAAKWFDVKGTTYGVGLEGGGIMYDDGTPVSDEFLAQEWELVEVLSAAAQLQ